MKNIGFVIFAFLMMGFQSCSSDDSDDNTKLKPAQTPMVIVDKDAAYFVSSATHAALYEIELDQLAIKQGQDKRVKNFGNIMAKEHIKALAKLKDIADTKKIPVPTSVTTGQQANIDYLLKNQGKAFDRAYMDDMAKNHEEVIRLFKQASKQLMDPDLRAIASKNVYNLQRHLDVVNMIRASIK